MVFLIPLASFMIFFGRISDDVGRARIFKIGLALFGLGAIGAYFSPSYTFLIAKSTADPRMNWVAFTATGSWSFIFL